MISGDSFVGREDKFLQFPREIGLHLLGPMADKKQAGLDDIEVIGVVDFCI